MYVWWSVQRQVQPLVHSGSRNYNGTLKKKHPPEKNESSQKKSTSPQGKNKSSQEKMKPPQEGRHLFPASFHNIKLEILLLREEGPDLLYKHNKNKYGSN